MVELRPNYQDCLLALLQYWREGRGNTLVDLPTGAGKSFVIAELSRRLCLRGHRALIVSHAREIIEQDAAAIRALWQDMPPGTLGINSAALHERNTDAPIILATVQSIFRNPQALGPHNLLIVDEAQRVPPGDTGMCHATINGLRMLHSSMRALRLNFYASSLRVSEWRAFEHSRAARRHPGSKWRTLGGREPIPTTASEAVRRYGELHVIAQIGVRRDG